MKGRLFHRSSSVLVLGTLIPVGAACGALSGLNDLKSDAELLDATYESLLPDAQPPDADAEGFTEVDAQTEPPDAGILLRSCKELRESGITTDGPRRIDPDGDGLLPAVDVYCDMVTDGGGWTLVARSVKDATGPFGWHVARGLVGNDAAPYALGDASLAIAFTEVLLATREGDGKALGEFAYKVELTPEDLATHETTGFTGYAISVVRGDCAPKNGPAMLRYSGQTSRATAFYFRDHDINDTYGLKPHGFDVYYGDCTYGGSLHQAQGMLFVR